MFVFTLFISLPDNEVLSTAESTLGSVDSEAEAVAVSSIKLILSSNLTRSDTVSSALKRLLFSLN